MSDPAQYVYDIAEELRGIGDRLRHDEYLAVPADPNDLRRELRTVIELLARFLIGDNDDAAA